MTGDQKIRSELDLLIRLCRLDFSAEHTESLKALLPVVNDWDYFARMANAHGAGALAYFNLEKLGLPGNLPEKQAGFLKNILTLNLARNTSHLSRMGEVLNILNNAGIKTVLLKGLALELTVYGNTGLRQMTDVDVLVAKHECIKARKLLLANGFRSLPLKSPVHKLIISHTGKHLPSLLKGDFSVEIHHSLFGAGKEFLTKMLYDSSSETDISGEKAFIPGAQLFFLYLVRHLSYHEMNNESQLRLYADLVVLLEQHGREILNTELIRLAAEAGMEKQLAVKLKIIKEFWGMEIPAIFDEYINIRYNEAENVVFLFFLSSPKGNPAVKREIPYKYVVREIPGLHRKILYVLGDIFPSVRFMKKRYGCSSGWKAVLYYPHRLGKLWYLIK